MLFALVVVLTPVEMVKTALDLPEGTVAGVDIDPIGWAALVAYFAACEGLLGATLGKALLGLRVSRVGQTGPPGLGRALVRATVFALIGVWILDGSRLAVALGASRQTVAGGFGLFVLATGFAALAVQLRQRWGFRGLHDFASGCHVTQKPIPARKLRLAIQHPTPLDTVLPPPADALPETVGGYVIRGRLSADSNGEQVWAAEDRALGRTVLLWLRPWGGAALPADPARPTRVRRLGTGTVGWGGAGYDWTAYAAPLGGPLVETIRPGRPLPWADARYLLEQLTDEFCAAAADGTAPPRLALDHLWVEPNGRVQVLDFPLCTARYRPGAPLAVLREAASLGAGGAAAGRRRGRGRAAARARDAGAEPAVRHRPAAGRVPEGTGRDARPPAGGHARRAGRPPGHAGGDPGGAAGGPVLARVHHLGGEVVRGRDARRSGAVDGRGPRRPGGAGETGGEPARRPRRRAGQPPAPGAGERPRRANAGRGRPAARLTAPPAAVVARTDAGPGAHGRPDRGARSSSGPAPDKSAAGRSNSPWGADEAGAYAAFAAVLLGMVLLAAILRGGVSLMLTGVAIVRADGRPAYRRQCAARAALVWFPVAGLLFGSALLQVYAPRQAPLAAGLWLAAAALLPVYAAVALRFPARPPHDRLVGTYLVPV